MPRIILAKDSVQPFAKGDDVEILGSGRIGEVIESDEDMTLVDWRNGQQSRIATNKLRKFSRTNWNK